MHCNSDIDLNVEDSIAPLLGFDKRILPRNHRHESDRVVKIMNVNTIKVECNLATGSFDNGLQSHAIPEFYSIVPPGYKIVEIPKYSVLYKLKTNTVFADADPTITAVVGNDSRIMLRTGAGGVTHTSVQKYKIVIFKILRSVTVWYNIYI